MPRGITGREPVRSYSLVHPAGTSGDTRLLPSSSLSADGKLSVQRNLDPDASALDAVFFVSIISLPRANVKRFFGIYPIGSSRAGGFLEKSSFHFPFTRLSLLYSHMRYPRATKTASRMRIHTATPP